MYELYCEVRDQKGLKDADVARATGINKSTFSDWKSGRSKPKNEKLSKIADFLGVSVDYLMSGSSNTEEGLSARNEKDIEKALKETLEQLDSQDGLMFDGEALDDNTKELLKISLENTIRTAKIAAKKKFTPKSIQNGDD